MPERHQVEKQLWTYYSSLNQECSKSINEITGEFYNQNSKFIVRNIKNPNPEIAVIIPAYNEEKHLAGTLASVNTALENQEKAIVVVVDNGSTDETAQIAKEFSVMVIREPKKGVGQARQTGLEAVPSSIRYVLTTDADTLVHPDWVDSHLNSLKQENVVCTHGGFKYFVEKTVSLPDKLTFHLYENTVHFVRSIKRKPDPLKIGGSNTGFRLDMARVCGGYNRDLTHGEDLDIIRKLSLMDDVVRIDNEVLTSARRIIGKGVFTLFMSGVKHNLQSVLGIKEPVKKPFINEFIDYR